MNLTGIGTIRALSVAGGDSSPKGGAKTDVGVTRLNIAIDYLEKGAAGVGSPGLG